MGLHLGLRSSHGARRPRLVTAPFSRRALWPSLPRALSRHMCRLALVARLSSQHAHLPNMLGALRRLALFSSQHALLPNMLGVLRRWALLTALGEVFQTGPTVWTDHPVVL